MGDIIVQQNVRVFLRQGSQTGRQKGGVGQRWQRDWKEERRDGGIMDDNVRNRRGASEKDYLIWLLSIQQRHGGHTHRNTQAKQEKREKTLTGFLAFSFSLSTNTLPYYDLLRNYSSEHGVGEKSVCSAGRFQEYQYIDIILISCSINHIPQIWDWLCFGAWLGTSLSTFCWTPPLKTLPIA